MNKHLKCFLKLLFVPVVVVYMVITAFVVLPVALGSMLVYMTGCSTGDFDAKLSNVVLKFPNWFYNL